VRGHGLAPHRGLGLASYLGLLLGLPTIGRAKSRLWGARDELSVEKSSVSPLTWEGDYWVGCCGRGGECGRWSFPPAI
jgi:deoxyinosine 3'endonuclease (endonuclease V)